MKTPLLIGFVVIAALLSTATFSNAQTLQSNKATIAPSKKNTITQQVHSQGMTNTEIVEKYLNVETLPRDFPQRNAYRSQEEYVIAAKTWMRNNREKLNKKTLEKINASEKKDG